jgi:hypothetical protein
MTEQEDPKVWLKLFTSPPIVRAIQENLHYVRA